MRHSIGQPKDIATTIFRHTYSPIRDNITMLIYDPKKIIALREGKTWRAAELARRSGLSQPTIWALEKGVTVKPKYETLKQVAEALGVPIKAILAERPKGKAGQDWDDQLTAAYNSLDDANKATLISIAHSLLKNQGRR